MTVRWRRDGVVVGTSSSTDAAFVLGLPATVLGEPATYVAEATNASGTVSSPLIGYGPLVVTPPEIVSQTGGFRMPYFRIPLVSVRGTPPFAYRWKRNGVVIPNRDYVDSVPSTSIDPGSVPGGPLGTYVVEISNTAGAVTSRPIEVTAEMSLDRFFITRQPDSHGRVLGQGVRLEVEYSSLDGAPAFQWRRDGLAIPGAT